LTIYFRIAPKVTAFLLEILIKWLIGDQFPFPGFREANKPLITLHFSETGSQMHLV
jgi:hypothetical protein